MEPTKHVLPAYVFWKMGYRQRHAAKEARVRGGHLCRCEVAKRAIQHPVCVRLIAAERGSAFHPVARLQLSKVVKDGILHGPCRGGGVSEVVKSCIITECVAEIVQVAIRCRKGSGEQRHFGRGRAFRRAKETR